MRSFTPSIKECTVTNMVFWLWICCCIQMKLWRRFNKEDLCNYSSSGFYTQSILSFPFPRAVNISFILFVIVIIQKLLLQANRFIEYIFKCHPVSVLAVICYICCIHFLSIRQIPGSTINLQINSPLICPYRNAICMSLLCIFDTVTLNRSDVAT